jgi:hypothetical protein
VIDIAYNSCPSSRKDKTITLQHKMQPLSLGGDKSRMSRSFTTTYHSAKCRPTKGESIDAAFDKCVVSKVLTIDINRSGFRLPNTYSISANAAHQRKKDTAPFS